MSFKISIKKDNSGQVINTTNQAVAAALEAMGLQAEKYAKLNAAVDTGRLRNSITHRTHTSEKKVYIGTNVEYAPYVEMGTYKMSAQPYLRPACANHLDEYRKIAQTYLKKV